MRIPFVDLGAQYLAIRDEIGTAIQNVLDNTSFTSGPDTERFEKEFAEFCGAKYAISVCSGTAAVHLATMACDLKPGDEVISTPSTFTASTEFIEAQGARPVFVDVDKASYNIDVGQFESAITDRTKAVIAVHLFGHPVDMDAIISVAQKYGLTVVEDAAHAHGAECRDVRVGTFGKMSCFSFNPGKILGAYGDAGMVVTSDEEVAEKVRLLKNHGRKEKYLHTVHGFNYRMDNLQAAILCVKLKRLEQWIEERRRVAHLYDKLLADSCVLTPEEADYAKHVYHLYVVKVDRRDALQSFLKEKGISTGLHYPIPLHLQPSYKHLGYSVGDFPTAESLASKGLSLPMYPELTEEQVVYVAKSIYAFR